MSDPGRAKNRRILVIDDNEAIHDDFRRILLGGEDTSELDAMAASLFGSREPEGEKERITYALEQAFQGEEGLQKVRRALEAGAPIALAFVDIRMPPGWDGVETIARLWEVDPRLEVALCSAYSDYSWEAITSKLGQTDRLLILKKPFDPIEVCQIACALTEKWDMRAELLENARRQSESEARSRALLDAIPDMILRISADGACLDEKLPKERSVIARAGHAPNASIFEVLVEDAARGIMRGVEQALATGAIQIIELQHVESGERHDYEARIVCGTPGEAVAVVRDTTERRRAEAELEERRRREQTITSQAAALAALSAPLIPISEHIVVMPLLGEMDAERAKRVREVLVQGVSASRASVAILDMTGVPTLDGATADELLRSAQAVRLLGSEIIVTGLRPEVARTLVDLGVDLSGIVTHRDLQSGVAFALQRMALRG